MARPSLFFAFTAWDDTIVARIMEREELLVSLAEIAEMADISLHIEDDPDRPILIGITLATLRNGRNPIDVEFLCVPDPRKSPDAWPWCGAGPGSLGGDSRANRSPPAG
jgi:hypothetical protein